MRQNYIAPFKPIVRNSFDEGSVIDLGIEQFPAREENKNLQGFPKNDVTLLLEVSRQSGVNSSRFEMLANRLQIIKESTPNKGKTIQQLFEQWQPATLQTPAEITEFQEYLHMKYDMETTSTTDDVSKSDDKPSTEKKVEVPTTPVGDVKA